MILGNLCTRGCGFCSVPKSRHPGPLDPEEPAHVARMAQAMRLRYVVITSVNRDDLADGGSEHFAQTVREVKRALPEARVETLTPDFCGDLSAVARVLDASPDVFNHNVETVPRLYRTVRPQADYRQSLAVPALRCEQWDRSPTCPRKVRRHARPGRNPRRSRATSPRSPRRPSGRGHAGSISPTRPPQSSRSRIHRAGALRILSRLRTFARLQDGLQRAFGAQLLYGRSGARAGVEPCEPLDYRWPPPSCWF